MGAHAELTSRMAALLVAGAGLALAGCAGGTREAPPAAPADPVGPAQIAARSVWGVAPDASSAADAAPELVRGSAIAVSEDTLLATCRVLGDRRQVVLVQRDAQRTATVAARDANGQVCALQVDGGALLPAAGVRGIGDLRVGEPLVAFANLTDAELAVTRGWLAATSVQPEPLLETTLVLPADTLSGVVLDARGNLIGLGSSGPTPDAFTLAAPVAQPLAPRLAAVEIGSSEAVQASLAPEPREADRPPPLWLLLDRNDRGGDSGSLSRRPPPIVANNPTVRERRSVPATRPPTPLGAAAQDNLPQGRPAPRTGGATTAEPRASGASSSGDEGSGDAGRSQRDDRADDATRAGGGIDDGDDVSTGPGGGADDGTDTDTDAGSGDDAGSDDGAGASDTGSGGSTGGADAGTSDGSGSNGDNGSDNGGGDDGGSSGSGTGSDASSDSGGSNGGDDGDAGGSDDGGDGGSSGSSSGNDSGGGRSDDGSGGSDNGSSDSSGGSDNGSGDSGGGSDDGGGGSSSGGSGDGGGED